jgi:hypothetical protein
LNILKDVKVLNYFIQKPSNPPNPSADWLYGNKPQSFPSNWASKMWESQQLFFGGWLASRIFEKFQHPVIQAKRVQHFGRFFHQIKMRDASQLEDNFYTNRAPKKQEVGGSGSEL